MRDELRRQENLAIETSSRSKSNSEVVQQLHRNCTVDGASIANRRGHEVSGHAAKTALPNHLDQGTQVSRMATSLAEWQARRNPPSPIGNEHQCHQANAQVKALVQLAREAWYSNQPAVRSSLSGQMRNNTQLISTFHHQSKVHLTLEYRKHPTRDEYYYLREYPSSETYANELTEGGITTEIYVSPYPHGGYVFRNRNVEMLQTRIATEAIDVKRVRFPPLESILLPLMHSYYSVNRSMASTTQVVSMDGRFSITSVATTPSKNFDSVRIQSSLANLARLRSLKSTYPGPVPLLR